MVNFAELKAKAEKVKDAGVTKVTNTRDRLSSVPSSKTNWDPNWKRGTPPPPATASPRVSMSGPPPPPPRARPDVVGSAPPAIPRTLRATGDVASSSLYTPPPPPSRVASGYPPSHRESSPEVVINWANLGAEDKEEFFEWLDEFFSRYLKIELSPRARGSVSATATALPARPPPTVNMATRPQV